MMSRERLAAGTWRVAVAAAVSVAVVLALLLVTSKDPLRAAEDLAVAVLANPDRISQWLLDSSFLMLTGAAVALVFRVGLFSLGAEGQVLAGALATATVALAFPTMPALILVALAAAAAAGFVLGWIPGVLKAYLSADEIITTLMLNYVAILGFTLTVKVVFMPPGAGFPVSRYFPTDALLPMVGGDPGIPGSLAIGLIACAFAWLLLERTRWGFAMRAVGSSQAFATATGFSVGQAIWLASGISGAIAGLAGAAIALGDTRRLIIGMSANYGFDGILVALLAATRPQWVPVTALTYGYLRTGGELIQITQGVPREVVLILQAVLILALTVKLPPLRLPRRRSRAAAVSEAAA